MNEITSERMKKFLIKLENAFGKGDYLFIKVYGDGSGSVYLDKTFDEDSVLSFDLWESLDKWMDLMKV